MKNIDITNILDEKLKSVEENNEYAYVRSTILELCYSTPMDENDLKSICEIVNNLYKENQ